MTEDDFEDKTVIADMASFTEVKPKVEGNASLVQYSGEAVGKRYELTQSTTTIGRATTADLSIPDASVSRSHAIIRQEGETLYLEDGGSANGTFINDNRITTKTALKDQDVIGFGKVLMKFFAQGNVDGFIQDKMYKMATIDVGTKIFNKQYLLEALEANFSASKSGSQSLSIVYFDLDHFKSVNDTHGHNAGDVVLLETAQTIKSLIRKDDIFGRFGGEEFVVILPRTEL